MLNSLKRAWPVALLVFTTLVAIFSWQFWIGSDNPSEENIIVGYRKHNLYLPLFVAQNQGYFESQGLQVEAVEFSSTNQLMESMLKGEVDLALGGVNTYTVLTLESKSPGSFQVFTQTKETIQQPSSYILAPADSDIQTLSDLKDKNVGVWSGSYGRVIVEASGKDNFTLDDINLVQMSPSLQIQALESGQVDAIYVLEPLKTLAMSKGNYRVLDEALYHKYLLPNLPLTSSVVSKQFAESQPDKLEKIIEANTESINFIQNNPEESSQIIAEQMDMDIELVKQMTLPSYTNYYEMNVDELAEFAEVLQNKELISDPVNVSDLIWSYATS